MIISLLFCLYLEFGINKCCFEESLLKVVVYIELIDDNYII